MKLPVTVGLVAGALALPLFAAKLAPQNIDIGDVATYTFSKSPVNAMGVKSLDELRGKPTLVEFWGTK